MRPRQQDGAERLLAATTAGLPRSRSDWGAAMRAELAAIEDADARRRFARSAARAAFNRGFGVHLGLGFGSGLLVAAIALTASRMQLADGGPGILGVTAFVPAVVLLLAALISARHARSWRSGLVTGFLALLVSAFTLFAVLAVEGITWMDRHGVFLLDGDPPRGDVGTSDIAFDIFTTGMWIGHLVLWLPAVFIGAAIGTKLGDRRGRAYAR